jgi:hypothetical protein
MSLATLVTGAIIADVAFDEEVLTYDGSNNIATVTYKLKGATRCVVTYTYDSASPEKVVNVKRVDVS